MNYFLLIVILGVCGGAYYTYTSDQQEITQLQKEVSDLNSQLKTAGTVTSAAPPVAAAAPAAPAQPAAPVTPVTPAPGTVTPVSPVTTAAPAPVAPVAPMVNQPGQLNAIDAAANAAVAASNSSSIGTVTTLNNKTYTNCKVLKVESDGVTFSHDDGITKILYPMMAPDLQQKFGYTPQAAVAHTEAEIRAEQQAAAATNGAPATP